MAYRGLGVEMMPDSSQPVITIRTSTPAPRRRSGQQRDTSCGRTPLSQLERVDFISSRSLANASIVIVNFKYGADLDLAMQDAQRRIDNIRQDLPEGLQPPVDVQGLAQRPSIMSLSRAQRPARHRSSTSTCGPPVAPHPAEGRGGDHPCWAVSSAEVQVKVDQERLLQHRVSLPQVTEAILRCRPRGARRPRAAPMTGQLTVKLAGKLHTVQDVEEWWCPCPRPAPWCA
ncbi:MAG: efflux RND transporter permease subunit [Flavobacteriales bacterium]|nr:efflux RND transporter permease subunit [Flavobacteriales bacterium]